VLRSRRKSVSENRDLQEETMHLTTLARFLARYARVATLTALAGVASAETAGPKSIQQTELERGKATATAMATYIVRLAEAPVVAYDGNVAGYKATRPKKGAKIDQESRDVIAYAGYLKTHQDKVLASVGGGKKLHGYVYTFNGFAAQLTDAQASQLAATPGVLTVWKDEELKLETNRTPAFLGLSAEGGLWSQLGGAEDAGDGMIIGMVDSGFWPENPSFSDRDAHGKLAYQNIPHWKGKCHPAEAFNSSNCNQKVIGARYYNQGFGGPAAVKDRYPNDFNSPRDGSGHGSHTASTAGGNGGVQAVVDGIDLGAISGMAPHARLSIYKTCYGDGLTSACFTSDSVAAIDQAVADGVDVINYSISGSQTSNVDAVEVAFLFAADAGVFVAASAGNAGPTASTVAHNSPWLMTVAAGTHDRVYAAGVTLGNGASYFGISVASGTPSLPVILASSAGLPGMPADQVQQCWSDNTGGGLVDPPVGPPGPRLDPTRITGKIVVCDRGVSARVDKSLAVLNAGGLGMILTNVSAGTIDPDLHFVPTVHVQNTDRAAIYAYVSTATDPTAQLLPGVVSAGALAPNVASFSSRGPARAAGGDLLKPDIMAPGVAILAAVSPASPPAPGRNYDFYQGTSMSSPHLAGIGALMKQLHPDWSPAMIKSALMTTASQLRNNGSLIAGGPFAIGSGHVDPNKAVDPGLVYAAGFNDWIGFLCGSGQATGCGALTIDPSDLNYPSIAIGTLTGPQTVTRRVTNVGGASSTYAVTVSGGAGLTVAVNPTIFTIAPGATQTYTVTFARTTASFGVYSTGSITWADSSGHVVRSPFAVRPVALVAPAEVSSNGSPINYQVTFGYTGSFSAVPRGLIPATTTAGTVADDPTNRFVVGGPGTRSFPVTIPTGTTFARFALFNDATDGADDLDLYVLQGTTIIAASTGSTSNEVVSFTVNPAGAPIPLTVVVHGFETDGPDSNFTFFNWYVGTTSAGNMTVTAPASATINTTGQIGLTFTGLSPATRYLGSVAYFQGLVPLQGVNPTIVSVTTP
jgi:hypothetical protein